MNHVERLRRWLVNQKLNISVEWITTSSRIDNSTCRCFGVLHMVWMGALLVVDGCFPLGLGGVAQLEWMSAVHVVWMAVLSWPSGAVRVDDCGACMWCGWLS